ncbi:hypothetical protein SUVZ_14G1790 [Saccharomyces uvarum]|uniref:YNL144C-like protein n=1 Tax=Saccharomyces uvarum TaxID=230603 RepID=A0ABN8WML0_SACUV|nr:hypothetical protein SUVZ_14G1790 [Saccharomyces uvarum]
MSFSIFGMTADRDGGDVSALKLSQTASSSSMSEEFVCSSYTSASTLDYPLQKVEFNHIDGITDADTGIINTMLEPRPTFDVGATDNNVLYCIDPYPVEPPCYDLANPSKVIRYPIYEHCRPCPTSVKPPSYTPSVEHYTVVSMKMEKLTPFESANSRLWNNFILQLNSTQINFYAIDDSLTKDIKNYRGGDMSDHHHYFKGTSDRHHATRSLLTAFTGKTTYQFDKYDKDRICRTVAQDKSRFLSNEHLCKSYSLQCAKVGLPIDYSSRDFVLRMRCEGLQFLVQFSYVDELINWAMYLNMGISLSLDLELRELPTYRSVPRRRHARARIPANKDRHQNKTKNKNKNKNKKRSNSHSHAPTLRRFNTSSVLPNAANVNERPKNKSRSRSLSLLSPSSSVSHDTNGPSNADLATRKNSEGEICGLFTSKLRNFFKTNSSSRRNSNKTVEQIRRSSELNSVQEELDDNGSTINTDISLVSPVFSPTAHSVLTSQSSIHENFRSRSGSNSMDPLHCDFSILKISGHDLSQDSIRDPSPSLLNLADRTIREEGFSGDDEDEDEDDGNYNDDDEEEYGEDDGINRLITLDEREFHLGAADFDEYGTVSPVSGGTNHDAPRKRSSKNRHRRHFDNPLKWAPAMEPISRKRYIKDSLRCIKPLTEDHPWTGKVIFKPAPPPAYETNNLPIRIHGHENSKDLRHMKNHYLKPYLVGSCGLLKTGVKVFHSHDKTNEVTIL